MNSSSICIGGSVFNLLLHSFSERVISSLPKKHIKHHLQECNSMESSFSMVTENGMGSEQPNRKKTKRWDSFLLAYRLKHADHHHPVMHLLSSNQTPKQMSLTREVYSTLAKKSRSVNSRFFSNSPKIYYFLQEMYLSNGVSVSQRV